MGLSILSLAFAKYLSLPIWIAFDICPDSYLFFVMHRLVACLCICKLILYLLILSFSAES